MNTNKPQSGVGITNSDNSSYNMQVKPNKLSSLINIVFDNYEETTALDYEIADKNGKVLLHGHWPVNKGQNKTIINLSLLANGPYLLSIRDKHNEAILVKQQVVKS